MLHDSPEFLSAVAKLKLRWQKSEDQSEQQLVLMVAAKEEVLTRYQPVFSLAIIDQLSPEVYRSFLLFRNNQHWTGLHRTGGKAADDISRLRQGLRLLLNEEIPIVNRLNQLQPKNSGPLVPYFGKAVITAILQIAYPEQYGVWNNTSESALKDLKVWPEFERGLPFGERYLQVNSLLTQLADAIGIDLWTLDALFWGLAVDNSVIESSVNETIEIVKDQELDRLQRFGLERHLQFFLFDNWKSIQAFSGWQLFEEDGDIVGFEYNTGEVGRIDLLARHKTENRWLVIELKRDQSSDQTVGQVLRYMGWVSDKLADSEAVIEGLVISYHSDQSIRYALKHVPNVKHLLYEVQFTLSPVKGDYND